MHVSLPETLDHKEALPCSLCKLLLRYSWVSQRLSGKESASASANTLTVKGSAPEEAIRAAVEKAGFTFKGIIS